MTVISNLSGYGVTSNPEEKSKLLERAGCSDLDGRFDTLLFWPPLALQGDYPIEDLYGTDGEVLPMDKEVVIIVESFMRRIEYIPEMSERQLSVARAFYNEHMYYTPHNPISTRLEFEELTPADKYHMFIAAERIYLSYVRMLEAINGKPSSNLGV